MMNVKFSKGNTKLGKIPNLSLPPIKSCPANVPCAKKCYAKVPYRMFPNVIKSWDGNLNLWLESSEKFAQNVHAWFRKNRPAAFRWHVSGDCPHEHYFYLVREVAQRNPTTRFLIFTKQYSFYYGDLPSNLVVILSTWPEWKLPSNCFNLPMAWLSNDRRLPDTYFKCPGKCHDCMKCWEIAGIAKNIVFDLH